MESGMDWECPFCFKVIEAWSWRGTKSNIIRGSCDCGIGIWYHNSDGTWSYLGKEGWKSPKKIPRKVNPF